MFNIKKADIIDIPLIRQLTFEVWPQTYANILTRQQIDYMLEMMYSEASLKKQIAEGSQFIFIYDETKPVGFASYQEIKPTKWKLHKIYVLISQQGKGTGKFMIDHIIDQIQSRGATSLELQVNINNKAKGFYEKLGFRERELINLDIGNGFFMNDYVLEKELRPEV
ncbi:MAG: GNAT family N-acetyltransferase [Chitinophagales bacterium]